MNRVKLGMCIVLIGIFIGLIGPVSNLISFVNEKMDLNSGYEMTRAEIILDEADYEEMTGYKKLTLRYTVNDKTIEKGMSKEEYLKNEYHPFINGGLIHVIYESDSPENVRVVLDRRPIRSILHIIVIILIFIYIYKNIYIKMLSYEKGEYKKHKYVDAKIISSDHLNRIVAMDESEDKIRIFKSFPYFNDIGNMSVFLKSKNIDKIRVYFDEKNENEIIMDYKVLSEVESND